jgi:hypothetical protein
MGLWAAALCRERFQPEKLNRCDDRFQRQRVKINE